MRIIHYPHPTLRHVSKPLQRVDADLLNIVREMFDLMYEHQGVGLAANQVDLPYRLFVANPTGDRAQQDAEYVFINPVIQQRKGMAEAEEGCLSIPGVFGQVKRPEKIVCTAYNQRGEEQVYELDGLFARVVQHEVDHLDGTLFIDRLSPTGQMVLKESLAEFELEFSDRRERGEIPRNEEIVARLAELEKLRT